MNSNPILNGVFVPVCTQEETTGEKTELNCSDRRQNDISDTHTASAVEDDKCEALTKQRPVSSQKAYKIPISLITVSKDATNLPENCGEIPSVRRILDRKSHFTGVFELVSGVNLFQNEVERGKGELLCYVSNAYLSDAQGIICEILRGHMTVFGQAEKIAILKNEHKMTEEKIAEKLGCSQSYVANKIRLLKFSSEERNVILRSKLTERHARTFLRIKSEEIRLDTIKKAASRKLNVAQTEE